VNGGHAVHEAVRAFVERRGAWTLAAGPLPSNVLDVLKLAARAGDKLDQWSLDLNIPPQRLAEIAGSFIENVLITPEASYYRVLGLEPDASEARITVHYNWLMQWLRVGHHAPELRAELAVRIKTAYRELSDASRRAAYDAAMGEALAARLQNTIQPAQYDPRKTPGLRALNVPRVEATSAPAPTGPTAHAPRRVAADAEDDIWHTETVLLDPSELGPGPEPKPAEESNEPPTRPPTPQLQCRPDEVIAVLTRPPTRPVEPVRSRAPMLLTALVLAAAAMLFVTRGQWLPWLESEGPAREVATAPTQFGQTAPVSTAAEAPESPASGQSSLVVDPTDTSLEVPVSPAQPAPTQADIPSDPSGATTVEPAEIQLAATEPAAEPSPPPAEKPIAVEVSPRIVPAEAQAAARRVGEAFAAGDAPTVLTFINHDGRLSQAEQASMTEDVKRWWFLRPGEPLSITATRVLPPIEAGGSERAAVELRALDDAGLRVILQREGLFWRVEHLLVIAPTASRSGGSP